MQKMPTYSDPNLDGYDGLNRIKHVPFEAGSLFHRRGGKAVDYHHLYRSAVTISSNLAGFAEVEECGVTGGRLPDAITADYRLPVNFALEKTSVFPTSGGVEATDDMVGSDFDLYVDANGIQYIDLNGHTYNVLRLSEICTQERKHVACQIPPDLRYGNI